MSSANEPLGNEHPVVHVVFQRPVRYPDGRQGPPPRGLFDEVVDVAQVRPVVEGGQPLGADYPVDLGARFVEYFGVEHHVQDGNGGCCEGLGKGVSASILASAYHRLQGWERTVLDPAIKTAPDAPWMSWSVSWLGMPFSSFSRYFVRSEYAKEGLAVPSSLVIVSNKWFLKARDECEASTYEFLFYCGEGDVVKILDCPAPFSRML